MQGLLDLSPELAALGGDLAPWLSGVERVFDDALRTDAAPVQDLARHVTRYRGKMLRPTLVFLSGLAAHPKPGATAADLSAEHRIVAAVVEMVHMATLVHDDVLDEAEVRRRGATINRLHGNEPAVMLGDYLFSTAYGLCASLPTTRAAQAVARAGRTLCEGELLQLANRGNFALTEAEYFTIIDRKTASLIAVAAELGAVASGATPESTAALERFARGVGAAFQIQDDLLDLAGDERAMGKPVGQDITAGKLTLPVIWHLAAASEPDRRRTLGLLAAAYEAGRAGSPDAAVLPHVRAACEATGSIARARGRAEELVRDAVACLAALPVTPARRLLESMAGAVVARDV